MLRKLLLLVTLLFFVVVSSAGAINLNPVNEDGGSGHYIRIWIEGPSITYINGQYQFLYCRYGDTGTFTEQIHCWS